MTRGISLGFGLLTAVLVAWFWLAADEAPSEQVEMPAGSVVRSPDTGSLGGSIVIPAGSVVPPLELGLQPVAPALWSGFDAWTTHLGRNSSDGLWWNSLLMEHGEFGWEGLPPGLYNVRLRMGKAPEDLVGAWGEIRVQSGVESRDSRLQGIEITGLKDWIRVVVVDVAGEPVEEGVVLMLGDWMGQSRWEGSWDGVFNTKGAKLINVDGEGFLREAVEVRWPETRVVLQHAPEVTLLLESEVVLADGWSLAACLEPAGDHQPFRFFKLHPFEDSQVRLSPVMLGRQWVQYGVSKGRGSEDVGEPTQFIDVGLEDAGSSYSIRVPEDVIERLRKKGL